MEIQINNDYKLIAEQNRFNISKRRVKNILDKITKEVLGTEEIWEELSFGYTLENAIDNIIKQILEDKDIICTLKEYVEEYKKVKNEIANILK